MATVRARSWAAGLRFAVIGAAVIAVLIPLYWVAVTSIKPSDDYLAVPPVWFPAHPTLVHYQAALFAYRGLEGLSHSVTVSLCASALSVLLGVPMGYSLARFRTGGRHLAMWVLSQRFLPPVAIGLPIFLLFRSYKLYDTQLGLVLVYAGMTLPLTVWMMLTYFRQLPAELEDAARVDGCTSWQAFLRVAVPLALPGIAAAAVFAFIAVWTEFFFALILTSRYAFTLPTVFRSFISFQGAQYGESSALAVVSLVPSILLGILVQRQLVRGLTLGAIR